MRDAKYRSVNTDKMATDFEFSVRDYVSTPLDESVKDVISLITAAEVFENCRDNLQTILPTLTSARALTLGVPLIGRALQIDTVHDDAGDNPYLLKVVGVDHTVPFITASDLKLMQEQRLDLPNGSSINCLLLCPTSLSRFSWVRNVQSWVIFNNEVYVHMAVAGLSSAYIDFLLVSVCFCVVFFFPCL